ncbi:Zinc finger mynd domain-containing protein 12 [Plakobranchus ocellatus]|uniref:Zinc finger mynd domain-containing protein 12 n=1 Tax=Plakobranchus ocellatus TaxID=259542 RepID=A0AAV3ZY94_9GAST|nr:Zinc finger mynd domain-containing protein 12 [Plakobranchus ocellatus]
MISPRKKKKQPPQRKGKPLSECGYDPRGFVRVTLLCRRKSDQHHCELCSTIGRIVCYKCKLAFYCTVQHFLVDKEFHVSMCDKMAVLKQAVAFSPLSEVREKWRNQRRAYMVDLFLFTWKKGEAHLDKSEYNDAIPAAMKSVTYAEALYGRGEEMIAPLLIAAESHLMLKRLNVAKALLAHSLTIELSKPEIRPLHKARIRHVEGLLALANDELQARYLRF